MQEKPEKQKMQIIQKCKKYTKKYANIWRKKPKKQTTHKIGNTPKTSNA